MIRVLLALLVLACCCPTHASDKHKQQRQKLNRRIERLEKRLRALEHEHDRLREQFKRSQPSDEFWKGKHNTWGNIRDDELEDRMCPRPDDDYNLYGVS
jgi:outer membrane murein-binding lipoprotein Lpp